MERFPLHHIGDVYMVTHRFKSSKGCRKTCKMSVLEDRAVRRLQHAVARLKRCCEALDSNNAHTDQVDQDGCVTLTEDDSAIFCKEGGEVLAEYMGNLCKGVDDSERNITGGMEESTQSQLLVEKGCGDIYSFVFANYLMSKAHVIEDVCSPLYNLEDCVSIPVGQLMKYNPARRALSLLSDYKPTDGNVRIELSKHGKTFLRKMEKVACHMCPLKRELHIQYIAKHLTSSGPARTIPLSHLNCSVPWIVYWSLHSLCLLREDIMHYRERAINTLLECWDSVNGGFGGGKGHIGHLATTYAAVSCFKMLDAIPLLDIVKMRKFLLDMKQDDGSYTVHKGGECDVRGSYCAIATAAMLNILTDELTSNVASHIAACQGYDGGIAGEPNLESHAGYVYCGAAALKLIGALDLINKEALRRWCLMRQTPQLGFQGRPHKLVDACYSFWIGGTLALLGEESGDCHDFAYSMLKVYILCIAQSPSGGFRDKPGKSVDLYHTCYTLSALEIVQGSGEYPSLDFALNIVL